MVISVAQAQLFFLALTRVLAIIIHLPVLAGPSVPNQVKIGLGILLAMVALPWQPLPPEAPGLTTFAFSLAIGREVVIGTLAGFAAVLTFAALQIAGEMMSIGSGFASGRVLNPAFESSGSAIDQLFIMTMMVLFFVINGHHGFLLAVQRTFTAIPLNSPLPDFSAEPLLRLTAQLILTGVQLALPITAALLLTDLTLGLLARVAPQIQVFFLGVPLKVMIALIALILSLGVLFPTIAELFRALGPRSLELVGV